MSAVACSCRRNISCRSVSKPTLSTRYVFVGGSNHFTPSLDAASFTSAPAVSTIHRATPSLTRNSLIAPVKKYSLLAPC